MSQVNSLHKAVSAIAAFSVAVSSASPVLLGGASVAAISVAMVSPAAAETCMTGISPEFANVLDGVNSKSDSAITEVKPKFGSALTDASLDTKSGTATLITDPKIGSATSITDPKVGTASFITGVPKDTAVTSVTAKTTDASLITNGSTVVVPVGNKANDGSQPEFFQDGGSDVVKYPNPPGISNGTAITGTLTDSKVVTDVSSKTGKFVTDVKSDNVSVITGSAATNIPVVTGGKISNVDVLTGASLNTESGKFVNGIDTKSGQFLTAVGGTTTSVVKNVTAQDSGALGAAQTSLGCGYKADASADKATAVGSETKAGKDAVALGYKATAALQGTTVGSQSEAGENSTALGFKATALGENSVAIGKGATTGNADNAVAVGQGAQAKAYGAVALGNGAEANGANSTAMGHNASTGGYTNATAIGAGATATRDNQVMLGTASNTYTAPGITSAASKAAQKGPLQVVTTDRNGNLASDGGAMYNNINNINSSITNLNANVAGLWNNVSRLNGAIDRLNSGVAMSMALGGMYLPEHKNYAVTANMGFYNNKQAIGINGMARLNETFVANGGIAFGVNGFGPEGNTDVGGRVGLTAAW